MSNKLTLPAEFAQRVTESMRSQIGQMIPQEALDKMVADEVNAFFFTEDTQFQVIKGVYGSEEKLVAKVTPFRALVWDLCRTQFNTQIKKALESEELAAKVSSVYEGQQHSIRAELSAVQESMLSAAIPNMLVNLLKSSFASAINQANINIIASMNTNTYPPVDYLDPNTNTVQNIKP